jgi:glyoxylase-like metal-dependent hydrolase (beta-lactamase superfamily II)
MLKIESFVLGPVETNAYLVADESSGEAAAVDPARDGRVMVKAAQERGWRITQIWLTHAHFDHIAGAAEIVKLVEPPPSVALHPDDLALYHMQGGAPFFGMRIDPAPEPDISLAHEGVLQLGSYAFEVRHAPGHTPGHVVFYCAAEKLVFCGDVVFNGSIGRTDLPGGSYRALLDSIEREILSLPDETRLLSGHGPETTVGQERIWNPFLS